jgi:hypothetical protein
MSHQSLARYLNDHLAGSVVALGLLESIEATYRDTARSQDVARTAAQLRQEIEGERVQLERVIERVGGGESALRKTAGWFAERFAQAKMGADDGGDAAFRLLEQTEVIALGILGKRGLWRALQSDRLASLASDLNLDALIGQAEAQYERMEAIRLAAARAALDVESA